MRRGFVLIVLGVAWLSGACTADGSRDVAEPTDVTPERAEGIDGVDLGPSLEGWSIHELDEEQYGPRPENDCRAANGLYDDAAQQRVFAAIRDSGGATVTVDLVEYRTEAAATKAYEMLVKLDVVCVLADLGGLSDIQRSIAPDSWLRIGGAPSYGWQAGVLRRADAVYPTLHGALAFAEGDVVAIVTSVRTDGVIDDPVPLATELRTQLVD